MFAVSVLVNKLLYYTENKNYRWWGVNGTDLISLKYLGVFKIV